MPVGVVVVDCFNDLRYTQCLPVGLVDLVTSNIMIKASIYQVFDDLPDLVPPAVLALSTTSLPGREVPGWLPPTDTHSVLHPQIMDRCWGGRKSGVGLKSVSAGLIRIRVACSARWNATTNRRILRRIASRRCNSTSEWSRLPETADVVGTDLESATHPKTESSVNFPQ